MSEETPAQKRAVTRKIFEHVSELKRYIDFKSMAFIKQGDGFSGIIVMFDEAIVFDEKVKE